MQQWDNYTHEATLARAKYLVNFSTELRDRLSGQGNELSHDDADYYLRQIIGMAESMRVTIEGGKVRALPGYR
jgi:hypothetical protein